MVMVAHGNPLSPVCPVGRLSTVHSIRSVRHRVEGDHLGRGSCARNALHVTVPEVMSVK